MQPLEVTCKNNSEYSVVIPPDNKSNAFAAQELVKYIKEATGALLPVAFNVDDYFISIGKTKALESSGIVLDYSTLNKDGFFIKFLDNNIYIVGANDRGTLYGVLEFLERFAGVKFINHDCTVVPHSDSLQVKRQDIVCIPYARMRNYYSGAVNYIPDFAMRLRMFSDFSKRNEDYGYLQEWFKFKQPHNSDQYVPYAEYKAEHPEFYSDHTTKSIYCDLCYSNGITDSGDFDNSMPISAAKAAAKSLLNFVMQSTESIYYMFGRQDDANAICNCKRCLQGREKFGGLAGQVIVFLNAVLGEVRKTAKAMHLEREIVLVTFAYSSTVQPPVIKQGDKWLPVSIKSVPDKDLHIRYAPINADYTFSLMDSRQSSVERERISGWMSLTPNIMIWDYHCCFAEYLYYFPNLRYMKDNIKLYADMGTSYIMNQSSYDEVHDWQAGFKQYIAAKLYWDIDKDVEQLLDEYLYHYYGSGAAAVRRVIQLMEDFWQGEIAGGGKVTLLNLTFDYLMPSTYPLELLENLLSILDQAITNIQADSSYSAKDKAEYILRLKGVKLTPMRMILRDYEFYYNTGKESFERVFLQDAEQVGIKNLSEGFPFKLPFIREGKCEYTIVTPQNAQAEVIKAANILNNAISKITGKLLDVITADKAVPVGTKKYLNVGDNWLFSEFKFFGINMSSYTDDSYYITTRWNSIFINARSSGIEKAVEVFLKEYFDFSINKELQNITDIDIVHKRVLKLNKRAYF